MNETGETSDSPDLLEVSPLPIRRRIRRALRGSVEFCPPCPAKGSCAGKVTPQVGIRRAKNSYDTPVILAEVIFTDRDGLRSKPKVAGIDRFDDAKSEELAYRLENRVGRCNGPADANCPALTNDAIKHLAATVMGDIDQ
ncbi:MAG TPA: hypothetical protein VK694_05100 [Verrucomicrobiae bacterium]|nr:hypothetical protein [Verrucomicrobiae bacterium]